MRSVFYFFILFALTSCQAKKEITYPEFKPITQSVYASGIVKSRNQYQVFSTASGIIEKMYVTEGDLVQQGGVIALIKNKALQLSKDNSQLAASFNAFQNNEDKLQELKNNVEVAKQKNEIDSLLYERQLSLWKQNVGSKVELEQRELNAKNSRALYESAVLKYGQLKKQIDFNARQAKKLLEISSAQANDLQVRSEVKGRVFSVLKKQGEMVTSQTPIAVIGESNRFYLELQVDEHDISQIKEGQNVLITMDSYQGKVFESVVSKIYPMMNERSRTFTLEADFVKEPERLYPFLTAEANIVIVTKDRALLIPRSYLIDDTFVLLENGERKKVQTGLMDYQKVEIISGLTDKDVIVRPL
jgi:multidrug efflux pump subunit AcrA (membrane-fusion protein)